MTFSDVQMNMLREAAHMNKLAAPGGAAAGGAQAAMRAAPGIGSMLGRAGFDIAKGLAGTTATAALTTKVLPKLFKPSLSQQLIGRGSMGRKALGITLLGAALGGGAQLAEKVIMPKIRGMSSEKQYGSMLEANPSLKHEEDKDTMKRFFKTLHTFSPRMAADPLVAGSFVRRSLQFKDEGVQPVDVKTLVDIEAQSAKKRDGGLGNNTLKSILSASTGDFPIIPKY